MSLNFFSTLAILAMSCVLFNSRSLEKSLLFTHSMNIFPRIIFLTIPPEKKMVIISANIAALFFPPSKYSSLCKSSFFFLKCLHYYT